MNDGRNVDRAVEGLVQRLVSAWNAHDPQAFAAAFAEDAEFTNVFGMVQRGRAGIEAAHTPIFKTMFRDSTLAVIETRLRRIRPDVAAVDVRWKMAGARDPMGNPWPEREGILNWILTLHGDDWLIDVSHNMDLPSAELAKAQAALSKP
ncbi:MAG TPA: SgcJ/EcaC family oxidoreductase [Alphaproteobacteria bacterium]|nr:SgcJ/EcaC family oxidoreductase [Alphaproteobacteria bacterium]